MQKDLKMPTLDNYQLLREPKSYIALSWIVSTAMLEEPENPSGCFDEFMISILKEECWIETVLCNNQPYDQPTLNDYEEIIVDGRFGLYEVVSMTFARTGKKPTSALELQIWKAKLWKNFREILIWIYFNHKKHQDPIRERIRGFEPIKNRSGDLER